MLVLARATYRSRPLHYIQIIMAQFNMSTIFLHHFISVSDLRIATPGMNLNRDVLVTGSSVRCKRLHGQLVAHYTHIKLIQGLIPPKGGPRTIWLINSPSLITVSLRAVVNYVPLLVCVAGGTHRLTHLEISQ